MKHRSAGCRGKSIEFAPSRGRPDRSLRSCRRDGSAIFKHHFSYPRIDQPLTPTTTRWNELNVPFSAAMMRRVERSESGDDDLYYEITLATSRLISVAWDDWEYGHGAVGCGAAHPNSHAKVETLMLSPVPHPMQPSGLFRQRRYGPNKVAPDTRWTDPIFSRIRTGRVRVWAARGYGPMD